MLNYIIFGLSLLSFILLVITLVMINKEKSYEDHKLESGINIIIFGLFFLVLFLLVKVTEYANIIFPEEFLKITPSITTYITYIIQISDLVFVPLIAICFLAAMLTFKKLF